MEINSFFVIICANLTRFYKILTVNKLTEQHNDLATIELLDEQSLKELIPQVGLRLRLWKKIEAFSRPAVLKVF